MKSKTSKRVRKVLAILPCMIVLFLALTCIINQILVSKEKQMLTDAGYYHPVSVGEYALNVYAFGNPEGKHTFVGMSGRGVVDFSVKTGLFMESFSEENRIVVVDRAGYGLSDDTKTPQTIETVVNDYRTALKNAGIEAPYILLPHSLGGAYATCWVSLYPEEIEGIVFLDGTQLSEDTDLGEVNVMENRLAIAASQMGLVRLGKSFLLKSEIPGIHYSDEQRRYSEALNLHNRFNYAASYEEEHSNEICNTAFHEIKTNDVPKAYICAGWGFQTKEDVDEMLEWDRQDCEFTGRKQPKVSQAMYDMDMWKNARDTELQPYLDKMGNCELVLLPGIHCIYDQRPEDVAEVIREFLDRIEE